MSKIHPKEHKEHKKLSEWFATAICGNDILSSTLYVSGIAIIFTGIYAPIVLLMIILVLYFYKKVYTEVVEALPINGGAYNCILNGTTKTLAAIAGVMTTLSYIATAVLSAKVGIEYLHTIVEFPVMPAIIALLLFFAILVIFGIKDSAKVALGIFSLHALTLVAVVVLGLLYYLHGHSEFAFNAAHTAGLIHSEGGLMAALYLGFSASLLGVSGFESSANFVEEQKKGVFRKTLRNMLIGVGVFNPLVALVVLNSLPFEKIALAKDFLLADVAQVIGGTLFQYIVAVDAFLVLAGAVLTAYVGVSGLLSRMAGDGCLPAFLSKQNSRGSHSRIIIAFFLLCSSILLITRGNLLSLAGVYTISFLGVMSFFAIGNLTLKRTRPDLKRTYRAPIFIVVLAFFATFFGMIGNIKIDQQNFTYFEFYFIPAFLIAALVIYQEQVLKFFMNFLTRFPRIHGFLLKRVENIIDGKFIIFIHHPDKLYSIINYVYKNEIGRNLILVHCEPDVDKMSTNWLEIKTSLPHLRRTGALMHFTVTPYSLHMEFGPAAIDEVSRRFGIQKNRILIGAIHDSHDFNYDELGGARIIV